MNTSFLVALLLLVLPQGQRPTSPFPPAAPESVGLSHESLVNLTAHVQSWIEDMDLVGAEILIVKQRHTVWHCVLGVKDIERATPVERDTICCIRSMTKTFTGTAIQILIDAGKLALGDRASQYLPSFDHDRARDITIDQLLTHTSGLPLTTMAKSQRLYAGQREVADEAGRKGPATAPGTQFQYSDAGTEALAAIVGVVSGLPPDEFIRQRILIPLGLHDTYCVLGTDAPDRARVSCKHGGIPGAWHKFWDAHDPPLFPTFLGSQSMYSTVTDYARFLAMWMDGGKGVDGPLLSPQAVARALTPRNVMKALTSSAPMPNEFSERRTEYGQLWMLWPSTSAAPAPHVFGHGGSDGTGSWVVPEQELIAVYFTQSRNGLTSIRFEGLLDKLIRGVPIDPPATRRPRAAERARFLGCYEAKAQGAFPLVFELGSRLAIDFGDQGGMAVLSWPDQDGHWRARGSSGFVEFPIADGDVNELALTQKGATLRWPRLASDPELPTVDEVMAQRREHLGSDAIAALGAVRLEGTIEINGAGGTLATLAASGGRYRSEWQVGEQFERSACDGERAWFESTAEPLHEHHGVFLAEAKLGNPLMVVGDWREHGATVTVERAAVIDGEACWALRVMRPPLPPAIAFVSADSGELRREELYYVLPGVGPTWFRIDYADQRDVEGVRLPFERTVTSTKSVGLRMHERYQRCATEVAHDAEDFRLVPRARPGR